MTTFTQPDRYVGAVVCGIAAITFFVFSQPLFGCVFLGLTFLFAMAGWLAAPDKAASHHVRQPVGEPTDFTLSYAYVYAWTIGVDAFSYSPDLYDGLYYTDNMVRSPESYEALKSYIRSKVQLSDRAFNITSLTLIGWPEINP